MLSKFTQVCYFHFIVKKNRFSKKVIHYIESKPVYVFSIKSTSASDGVMGPQCLIYLDSVWNGSQLIQMAGPEIWVREVKWEHLNEIWTPVNLNEFP